MAEEGGSGTGFYLMLCAILGGIAFMFFKFKDQGDEASTAGKGGTKKAKTSSADPGSKSKGGTSKATPTKPAGKGSGKGSSKKPAAGTGASKPKGKKTKTGKMTAIPIQVEPTSDRGSGREKTAKSGSERDSGIQQPVETPIDHTAAGSGTTADPTHGGECNAKEHQEMIAACEKAIHGGENKSATDTNSAPDDKSGADTLTARLPAPDEAAGHSHSQECGHSQAQNQETSPHSQETSAHSHASGHSDTGAASAHSQDHSQPSDHSHTSSDDAAHPCLEPHKPDSKYALNVLESSESFAHNHAV